MTKTQRTGLLVVVRDLDRAYDAIAEKRLPQGHTYRAELLDTKPSMGSWRVQVDVVASGVTLEVHVEEANVVREEIMWPKRGTEYTGKVQCEPQPTLLMLVTLPHWLNDHGRHLSNLASSLSSLLHGMRDLNG